MTQNFAVNIPFWKLISMPVWTKIFGEMVTLYVNLEMNCISNNT